MREKYKKYKSKKHPPKNNRGASFSFVAEGIVWGGGFRRRARSTRVSFFGGGGSVFLFRRGLQPPPCKLVRDDVEPPLSPQLFFFIPRSPPHSLHPTQTPKFTHPTKPPTPAHTTHYAVVNTTQVIVADAEREHWKRKPAPDVNPSKDSIVFQQLDIDYVIGEPHPMLGDKRRVMGPAAMLRIFGGETSTSSPSGIPLTHSRIHPRARLIKRGAC